MADLSSFAPEFEACPTQTRRRSSIQSGVIDYQQREEPLKEEPRKSSSSSSNSNSRKKKKSRRGSSSGSKSPKRRSADPMDGSMGQSGATDMTEEVDNSSNNRTRRTVAQAVKPGAVQDKGRGSSSSRRSTRSAEDKIREFNSQGSSSAPQSDHEKLMAEKYAAAHRPGAYTATQEDDGYVREKARLFGDEAPEPEPVKEPSGMEHESLLNSRSVPEEKKKMKGASVAPSPAPIVSKKAESFDDEFDDIRKRSKKNTSDEESYGSHGRDNKPLEDGQTQVIASHGVAGAPSYQHATTNGGFAGPGFDDFDDEGLAIAIAVDEDYYEGEQNTDFYHHAIEYNPDAKPPLHRNRRFRFYLIMLAAFFILAGTGVAVCMIFFVGNKDADTGPPPTSAPSGAPTTRAEGIYRVQFASIVGEEVDEPNSPQDRAAIWIMYEDQIRLPPGDEHLIQRYILAFFYFFTTANEEKTWKSCNRPRFNEDAACDFMRFKRDPMTDEIYFEPEAATRWLSSTHECDWIGVQCDETDTVVALELWGQNITGPMPGELSYIPFIQRISLAFNAFSGHIPEQYAEVRHLLDLEVHGNQLTGTIPDAFWKVLTLQNFNIGENQLTGTLSTEVGLLTNLKGLHYSDNNINGTIPTELGNLQYLSYTRGDKNALTGAIPTELGQLSLLQELWLQENLLSGTIPTEVGNLVEISDFRIFRNRIYGTIPDEMYDNKSQLTRLDLHDLLLSGTLSTRLGELKNLQSLRVRSNRLTGTVPTEIARIRSLRLLWVHLNEFTGPIPLQVCSRVGPGALEFVNADCGPEGNPAQECVCCHSCCDRSTELCQLTDDLSS